MLAGFKINNWRTDVNNNMKLEVQIELMDKTGLEKGKMLRYQCDKQYYLE